MKRIASFGTGLVFGLGLALSGMTNPAKVTGFLDVTGRWDPTLAWVMAGAVTCCGLLSWAARQRRSPLLEPKFHVPEIRDLDTRLLSGAVIFGIGWGVCGVCPGPAIVSLGSGGVWPFVFVFAMALGARAEAALSAASPLRVGRGLNPGPRAGA